jgi:hypothetical protein
MVTKWATFWTKYRRILTEDIIHLRRPTVSTIDAIMHVSSVKQHPEDDVAGLAMVYNPTDVPVNTTIRLPCYYMGITDVALVEEGDRASTKVRMTLDGPDYGIDVRVNLPAKGITWFTVQAP